MRRSSYGPAVSASSSGGRRFAASPSWASGFWSNEKMKYDFGFTSPSRLSVSAESSNAIPVRSRSSLRTASGGMCANRAIRVLDECRYACRSLRQRTGLAMSGISMVSAPLVRRLATSSSCAAPSGGTGRLGAGYRADAGRHVRADRPIHCARAVALHVITAPRPGDQNGLYQLAPVLSRGTVGGTPCRHADRARRSRARRPSSGSTATSRVPTARPPVMLVSAGLLLHPPLAARSSIGIDAAGHPARRPCPLRRRLAGYRSAPAARPASTRLRLPARSCSSRLPTGSRFHASPARPR